MLLEVNIENFYSFKDRTTFSMEATKYDNDKLPFNYIEDNRISILKGAVIFGANASGKSNLIISLKYIRHLVETSFQKGVRDFEKFRLNGDSQNKPTSFEIKFLMENQIFRYGFKIEKTYVVEEWLYRTFNIFRSREVPLFIRKRQNFKIFSDYKKESSLIVKQDKVRENSLFLPVVAQFNGLISLSIMKWFEKLNAFSCIHNSDTFETYTYERLSNEKEKIKIVEFLKSADFGISGLEDEIITLKDLGIADEKKAPKDMPKELIDNIVKGNTKVAKSLHPKYNDNQEFLGYEGFQIAEESDGTQTLFKLAGPILETLEKGEILVIDELDSTFHTKMTEKIVKLFNSKLNKNNAQLIFATHDTNLLTQNLFRRDQIWFVEKNNYGESNLFSLIDFGIRKDTLLEKNYLDGKYGAIPYISELSISLDEECDYEEEL